MCIGSILINATRSRSACTKLTRRLSKRQNRSRTCSNVSCASRKNFAKNKSVPTTWSKGKAIFSLPRSLSALFCKQFLIQTRYSQLSADFARLSRELEARKAQMRRESLSSTPPSRPPMSPLRHALSKDNLAISPLPFAQEVVVELPVSEPTSKSNSDIEVVASGGLATSSIEVTVEEPSCLASTEDLVALQSLQDRLDEREHELRLAYQQMAKAGLRVRSRSGSDSSSPMRPENLETIQTCQWCHDIFLVGDEVECPDAPAHHAKKFRQTASGGLFPCCSGGRDSVGCIKGQHSAVGPCDLSDLQEHEEAAPVPAMSASLLSDDSWYDASSVPITEAVIRAELKHGPISLKALTARLISETWTKPEKIEAQTTLRTTLFSMEDSNELLVNIVDESLMLFLQSK